MQQRQAQQQKASAAAPKQGAAASAKHQPQPLPPVEKVQEELKPGIALERTGHVTAAAQAFQAAIVADSTYGKAAASLARVQQLKEDPSIPPVDLTSLVGKFVLLIEQWKTEAGC